MTPPEDTSRSEEPICPNRVQKPQHLEHDYWTRVINGTPTIVCGITTDGTTTFINAAGERITGYSNDEIVGRNWWRTFYPGDEYRQVEQLLREFEGGDVRDYEMTLTTKQGAKCTFLWTSVKQFDAAGRFVEVIGFGNDITQRKRAESLMRAQRDLGMALSAETDLTHALTTCLDAALKASGMDCGGVFLMNQSGGINLAVHKGLPDGFAESQACFDSDSRQMDLIKIGKPIYIENDRYPATIQDSIAGTNFTVTACLPVVHEGKTIACLNLASFRLKQVPPESRDALEAIAAQVGTAIARIGAAEKLRAERLFLKQVLEFQERERKLVAYEIHDGLAQQLTGALMQLQASRQFTDRHCEEADRAFDMGLRLLTDGLAETRRLIAGLRPMILDELGVIAAINHLINETVKSKEIEIEFVHGKNFQRLMPLLETAIFRVVQEALTNVCRHSQSNKARVELIERNGHIRAAIEDWGIGFDLDLVEQKRFGLRGIRERAKLLGGQATVNSTPGSGTRIEAEFPLVENSSGATQE